MAIDAVSMGAAQACYAARAPHAVAQPRGQHVPIWFAAAAVLFEFGGRSGKRAGIRGLASIGVTSAIVNFLIKPVVKRKRPARDRIPAARQLVREPLSTSFPSGHAASAFAFVSGVALESRRVGALLAPIAAAVAYSRTFNGVHYPLDVAAGAVIGMVTPLARRRPVKVADDARPADKNIQPA